ncbi:3-hydroxyisobutyrate dehydrogenase [Penicillium coprophilum]|uniref:3-hydroxyisobutyrate dehydrogenase n=1 Tax=Penicillium coprophilum TaxID=36646 RepID=UPI00238E251D|nr:3-hydroxyisobutyrate dehydrogenase [Penicillium coprophilum]KAJ5158178.1 3-hydroxyisobutyrate dehydrogenase [Penicillium coprophilum]
MPRSDNLVILDINEDVMSRFVKETKEPHRSDVQANTSYVEIASSVRDLAEKSNIIISCLPTVKIVQDTYSAITTKGALPPLQEKQERLFIDCSTIDPPSSRQIASSIQDALASHYVDAPVSGGAVGAQAGTLSFMYGTPVQSPEFINRVESVLQLMGTKVWHMGGQGCGVSAKLANNYILAINNIATSEALNMGRAWGLDLQKLTELINSSTGHCWPMEVNNPVPGVVKNAPASNGYEPGCPVSMINKDLGLAIAGATDSKIPLLLANTAREAYDAVDKDHRGRDFSIVYQWLQNKGSK